MIHSLAFVDNASVAPSARVWQFASVIRGATVGAETSVGANAIVDGATVGDNCAIGHAASVHPGSVIDDNVFVGPHAVLCNDMWPATEKAGWEMPAKATVVVCDGASIGAGAIVLPGVRVGASSVVAAGAVVDRDVPDGMVWRRNGYISQKPANWRERRMRHANDNDMPMAAKG